MYGVALYRTVFCAVWHSVCRGGVFVLSGKQGLGGDKNFDCFRCVFGARRRGKRHRGFAGYGGKRGSVAPVHVGVGRLFRTLLRDSAFVAVRVINLSIITIEKMNYKQKFL